jgi:hypothetical protein
MGKVELLVRPLAAWPGPQTPANRRDNGGRFLKVTPGAALDSLREELGHIRAKDCRIQLDVRDREITRYGELRADARPSSPGVVVYATHPRQGDIRFANDTFARWHHNVRAIAMTLEALRGIARWGAVRDEQQFAGFRALPGATALTMGVSAATAVLEAESGLTAPSVVTAEWLREAIRRARAATHPDAKGGDRVRWDQVEQAARVLGGGD